MSLLNKRNRNFLPFVLAVIAILLCTGWIGWGLTAVEAQENDRATPGLSRADVQAVMEVQNRHTHKLMQNPDVVGTATGLDDDGNLAIMVFTKKTIGPGVIPQSLEGKKVHVKVTGPIFAMKRPAPGVDPTQRFSRPVPIGVSTGNVGECSAGTIGARVKNVMVVYALSNNHVYALENDAVLGSDVVQPGRYDTSCLVDDNDIIGTLYDFVPIDFAGENTVDAAIAISSREELGNATPADGYGVPKATTVEPALGLKVQKYGRTSSLTKGSITGINSTILVGYSNGTARFTNQILVQSRKTFIKAGDSGSLLVTDPDKNPVGLLFAGDSSGKWAWANPIDDVLDAFNVVIDGE